MHIQNPGIMHIPNSRNFENLFKYPRWSALLKQLTAIIIFADLAKYSRNISFSCSLLYVINIMNFLNTGLISEAAVGGGQWKKLFLKLLQHSQENMCWVPSTRVAATLLKRESKQMFSCQYCEIFKKTYFEEHLRTAGSVIFSQDVFTLCQQYGGQGSGDVYLDTSPIKHLRWSFLPK